MIEYKIMPIPKTPDEAVESLKKLLPLFNKYWIEKAEVVYGKPFYFDDIQAAAFIRSWRSEAFFLFVAEEDGELVGFLMAYKTVPFFQNSRNLVVEHLYGKDFFVEDNLCKTLSNVLSIVQPDEVTFISKSDLSYIKEFPGRTESVYMIRKIQG